MRVIARGEDSPVVRCKAREGESRKRNTAERQVDSNQSPHVKEQSIGMVNTQWIQERKYDKGRKL